jgi:hypothetical protein
VRARGFRLQAAIVLLVLALLAAGLLIASPADAASDAITTCLQPCHATGSLMGPDVETDYMGSDESAGHKMGWDPRVVADTKGARLAKGARMPCSECHVVHGTPSSSIYLFSTARTGGSPITVVRDLCVGCHRPNDSSEGTPTVQGLRLRKMPSGPTAHTEESTTPCSDCHGATAHSPEPHGDGSSDCGDESCHGGSGSHAIHLSADDPRGPGQLDCTDDCHQSGDFPNFSAGTDTDTSGSIELDETTVCDECHSPGGDYDGVDSAGRSIGAKDNWASRVYETTSTLQAGKERWCAGCHDGDASVAGEEPSLIDGVYAPAIAGDEQAVAAYGPYGYYETGHGLEAGVYPASGAPAARVECDGCHDYTYGHIDGNARTYSAGSDNYQAGYRLRSVSGQEPFFIPRYDPDGMSYSGVFDPAYARLCFDSGCHDSDLYANPANLTTNFREEASDPDYNSHELHMVESGAWPNRWDSDWNGSGDSMDNCPACHNVHGSPSPAMIRHGELISTPGTTDKVPALNFKYTTSGAETWPTREQSNGGRLDLPGGGGSVGATGVCGMCHAMAASYTRTPTDFYPPKIATAYGTVGSDLVALAFTKGTYTNPGSGALVSGDFALTDTDDGRTVVGVSHAAGDEAAVLTVSSALDGSSDIGVDTIGAATGSSIYDAAGLAMETDAVTILGDSTGPTTADLSPGNGATEVARDADVTLTLADAGSGVDWSTFSITLSGDGGYAKTYTDVDTGIVSKTGTRLEYAVTVSPDELFGLGEVITVTVGADDFVGNALTPPTWVFTVTSTATASQSTLHPSGLGSNPGGYWTVPTAGQWATYLDSNDGDTTYATSNTGSRGAQLYMAMDTDGNFVGSSIEDLTVHVLARYVSGWSPSAPPVTGDIHIGYKTGTATVWDTNRTLAGTGSYIHVTSPTYTTDSDGGALDVSDIDGLQLAVERRLSGGYPLRITEMYAVVSYIPGGGAMKTGPVAATLNIPIEETYVNDGPPVAPDVEATTVEDPPEVSEGFLLASAGTAEAAVAAEPETTGLSKAFGVREPGSGSPAEPGLPLALGSVSLLSLAWKALLRLLGLLA